MFNIHSKKPHAKTTKDPRFNVSPYFMQLDRDLNPGPQGYEDFSRK